MSNTPQEHEGRTAFGADAADRFINRFNEGTPFEAFECRLCAEMPQQVQPDTVRAHVKTKHADEYRAEVERRASYEGHEREFADVPLTPFGELVADEFISNENTLDDPIYGCKVCEQAATGSAWSGGYHSTMLSALREHVVKQHATEYAERAEARGTAFVQREGDFEKYAAMPVPDETFGEYFADAGLSLGERGGVTIYQCDRCDDFARTANDDAHRLSSDDLTTMRVHVEKEHPRVVIDEATRRAATQNVASTLKPSGKCVLVGSVPDVVAAELRAEPPFGALATDEPFITAHPANGLYSCKTCSDSVNVGYPTTDLGDIRAHVAKRHVQEVAEFNARHSAEVVRGHELDAAQRRAREMTGFDPTRPMLDSTPAFGDLVSDKFLRFDGGGYACTVCVTAHTDLKAMRQHVEVSHSLLYQAAAREDREGAPFKTPLGYRIDDLNGATEARGEVFEHTVVGRGERWDCRFCTVTVYEGFDRAKGIARLREHVATAHADLVRDGQVAPNGTDPITRAEPFEIDREALYADETRARADRRVGEFKLDLDRSGDALAPRFTHTKCGETFGDFRDALSHECAAERLPASDDVVLLKAFLTADASTRRRERASYRDKFNRIGALATHIREYLDDLFELLAEASAILDADERRQFDDERERNARLKR